MSKLRGGTHTTLTETAKLVVSVLEKIPGVLMISPGIITKGRSRSGQRRVTAVFTTAGIEFIISGQSIQKVAVHCRQIESLIIFSELQKHKRLSEFSFSSRDKKPGI